MVNSVVGGNGDGGSGGFNRGSRSSNFSYRERGAVGEEGGAEGNEVPLGSEELLLRVQKAYDKYMHTLQFIESSPVHALQQVQQQLRINGLFPIQHNRYIRLYHLKNHHPNSNILELDK